MADFNEEEYASHRGVNEDLNKRIGKVIWGFDIHYYDDPIDQHEEYLPTLGYIEIKATIIPLDVMLYYGKNSVTTISERIEFSSITINKPKYNRAKVSLISKMDSLSKIFGDEMTHIRNNIFIRYEAFIQSSFINYKKFSGKGYKDFKYERDDEKDSYKISFVLN